jgi:hypothetical protein
MLNVPREGSECHMHAVFREGVGDYLRGGSMLFRTAAFSDDLRPLFFGRNDAKMSSDTRKTIPRAELYNTHY